MITNTYLSAAEYEVLSVFEGNEIRKNRYPYEYEGRKYSIDVFLGALWGLVLAETEFETDEELSTFMPPPFIAREVTNDETFTGGRLVELTFEELRERQESEL
jgi:CYTH domain-containing protein